MRSSSSGVRKRWRRGGNRLNCHLPIKSKNSQRKTSIQLRVALSVVVCVSPCIALTGCSGEAKTPAPISISTVNEPCGSRDDGLVQIQPRFNNFTPPVKGGSYTDPQYSCAVVRLTDAKSQFKLAVHHQYSTISAVNQDDPRVMLITDWGQGAIVDMAANVVVAPRDFPAINAGNVPWGRHPAEAFYYTNGNVLYRGLISGHAVKSTA